ncbi:MAG: dihydrofolate reductase family protein [Solirubrobacteraceae bacterium]
MAKLIYSAITSLDGYIEDENGKFDWGTPDEELHALVNDLMRPIGTHLYGRRMYETMVSWERVSTGSEQPGVFRDFAEIWRAAEKRVYSRTLEAPSSQKTRIEREFDQQAIRELKSSSSHDLSMGGPALTAQAFGAKLVDECHLFLMPIAVGGGKRALPAGVRMSLELLDHRSIGNGVLHLRYGVRS